MKIETSATVAISNEAMTLRKKGIEVFDFSAGDLVLQNHPVIIDAIKNIKPFSPYSPVPGLPELREEAARLYNAKPSEVIITPGGKFALFATLSALLNRGDKVIVEKPYWPSYPSIIELAQGSPVFIDSYNAPLPKAKALILNNPNNPTGKVYDKSEVDSLLTWSNENDSWIISDEVYSNLIFTDRPYYSTPRHGRTITIQSLSKNYAMAGFRIGFIIAPESLVKDILPIIGQTVTTTSHVSQIAALAALKHSDIVLPYVKEAVAKRRALFIKKFESLFGPINPPEGAIYFFCPISKLGTKETDDRVFCKELIEKAHVALIPGTPLGKPGFVRFTFSAPESEIEEGLNALRAFIKDEGRRQKSKG